jgi:hypothetical protein
MRLGFSPEQQVSLDGKLFRVDVSFRSVMRVSALLKDSGISERVRVGTGLKLLLSPLSHTRSRFLTYPQKLALLNKIFELLAPPVNSKTRQNTRPVISLEADGALIYGAFLQTYGIDLQYDGLDWREFCVLFSCLPESTALFSVMKSRLTDPSEDIHDGLETLFDKLIRGN